MEENKLNTTKDKLKDILLYLKWGNISKDYLGFSRGWIYQRLNGYDGNGNDCDLNEDQKNKLKLALLDLSQRIGKVAETL